jgi:general stress protein YciG
MVTKRMLKEALRELGRRGGKAAARSLTPEERTARARKGGLARQAKARATQTGAIFIDDDENVDWLHPKKKGGTR